MKPAPYMPPHMPTPQERAERRARMVKFLVGTAVALPLLFAVMAYGYSDQAPAGLRDLTMKVDGAFGAPVWEILRRLAS
jgi:hypothetical protein